MENYLDKIFTAELLVPTVSDIVGKLVKEIELLNSGRGHLHSVTGLDNETLDTDSPQIIIGGDRIVYSGTISEILKVRMDYCLATSEKYRTSANEMNPLRRTVIAVVEKGCTLIGLTVNSSDFEKDNHIIIMAIYRNNETITDCPRNIIIQEGDVLLVDRKPKGKGENVSGLRFIEIKKPSLLSSLKNMFR